MRIPAKPCSLCLSFFLIISHNAFAEGNITINNNTSPQQPQAAQPVQQCGGNQNNVYDPRVLPEGSYVIKNSDGSSNQLYTTGEKKPYYVDNSGCNGNSNVAPVQPYVFMGGGGHRR